jgi:hypothetical protein
MKRFIKSKKGLALLAALVVAIAASVGAYAYFTSSGNGNGSAQVASGTNPWTVNVDTNTAGDLVPTAIGDSNAVLDTINYSVANQDEGNEYLGKVVIQVDPSYTHTDLAGDPACTAADFSINSAAAGSAVTLHPNVNLKSLSDAPDNEYDSSFTLQLVENNANQDSCEGQTIPLQVAASTS